MRNYLLPVIDEYFDEMMLITGRMYTIAAILPGWHTHISKEYREPDDKLSGSIICLRDLTLPPKSDNLIVPNFDYDVNVRDIPERIEEWVSLNCGLAVLHGYEVFETYFVKILATYFLLHPEKMVDVKLLKDITILSEDEVKKLVKNNNGVNNKGLIKMMKLMSPYFAKHESSNYLGVNIFHWFDILSMVRHSLVHNRQVIGDRFAHYLEVNKSNKYNELFERQFGQKSFDNRLHILLNSNRTADILTWLNSFAHLIFKSLSLEENLSSEIRPYIPTS